MHPQRPFLVLSVAVLDLEIDEKEPCPGWQIFRCDLLPVNSQFLSFVYQLL